MKPPAARAKGTAYERVAEKYLVRHGLELVTRNFTCRLGELDLVMLDGAVLAFVEVRYRENTSFGNPLETITTAKRRKLVRTAEFFLCRHPRFSQSVCRFDAVGLSGSLHDVAVNWIKNAFSA